MENKLKVGIQAGEAFYKGTSIEKVARAAKQHGVGYLQLWYTGLYSEIKDNLREAEETLDKYKLGVSCLATWTRLNFPGDVASQQKTLMEAIDLAERFDTRFVATYFGSNASRDEKTAIETYKRNIAPCLEKAARKGVTLVTENEFDHSNEDPTRSDVTRRVQGTLNLLEAIDSPHFKLTFDATNVYNAGEEPYPYAYELLKDHIVYVHVKDTRIYSEHLVQEKKYFVFNDGTRAKYLSVPLGEGAVNHEALLKRMLEDGYEGFFVIEAFCLDEQYDEFYRKAVEYLGSKGIG